VSFDKLRTNGGDYQTYFLNLHEGGAHLPHLPYSKNYNPYGEMTMQHAITLQFLGHASFKLITPDDKVIFIDPWFAGNPVCPEALKKQERADLILITHGHEDHFDADLPAFVRRTGAQVVAPMAVRSYLNQQGVHNTEPMNAGNPVSVCGIPVTMTFAHHGSYVPLADGTVGFFHEAVGYVVEAAPEYRIYFAGDTGIFSDMRLIGELYQPQLAVLPIAGRYMMGPREAAHALRLLNVKKVVPFHYGSMPSLDGTPEELAHYTGDINGLEILIMKPGDVIDPSE
jgi:L-ascorbate metabolism protein UlaG (beta-lactamase superfamily)